MKIIHENAHLSDSKVLVIEDYTPLRNSLKELIAMHYKVRVAKNTKDAKLLIDEEKPDLIISDVMLPDQDGFQFIKILKTDPRYSLIPVIFLTALSDENNLLSGFDSGGVDYVTKPFKKNELLARMQAILSFGKNLKSHIEINLFKKGEEDDSFQSTDKKFERIVLDYINSHFDNPGLCLPEIALYLNTSVSSLERNFKRILGMTLALYLKRYRLTRAEIMIKQGLGNVNDISYLCGFSTQQYFSKCFKEHFGEPPLLYKSKWTNQTGKS